MPNDFARWRTAASGNRSMTTATFTAGHARRRSRSATPSSPPANRPTLPESMERGQDALVHLHPAGDVEGDAGDVRGAAEIDDRFANVLRRLLAPERGGLADEGIEGL